MKKLILSVILIAGLSTFAFAQNPESSTEEGNGTEQTTETSESDTTETTEKSE